MIDLKECIKFCIENFTAEEATDRLYKFVNESLELKEKEIELITQLKFQKLKKKISTEKILLILYKKYKKFQDMKFTILIQ